MSYSNVDRTADAFATATATGGASLTGTFTAVAPFLVRRIGVKVATDFSYLLAAARTPAGGLFRVVIPQLGNKVVAQFSLMSATMPANATQFGGLPGIEDVVDLDMPINISGAQLSFIVQQFDSTLAPAGVGGWSTFTTAGAAISSIALHFKFYE